MPPRYDAARRLRDRADETGNRQHRAWALRCLAVCALRRNEPAEAVTQLQAALECLGETAALNERIPTLGILALAQLQKRRCLVGARDCEGGLSQVVNVTRPIGQSTLEGYSSLVTVALDAWQEERSPEWRRAIVMCLRVLRRYRKGFPVGEPRYQLHRGDFSGLAARSAPPDAAIGAARPPRSVSACRGRRGAASRRLRSCPAQCADASAPRTAGSRVPPQACRR